jgi:uncharacterized protein (DUF1501 family)
MAVVARLVAAGAPTCVYQVSMSSFDTHADEKATHERLLGELDAGITALLDGVAATARARDVVAVTVSEPGRRPAQNAIGGTDHGTAAPMLVAGHGVNGGLYGDEPSLGRLDAAGNLVFTTDFRSVYATLLDRVVGVEPVAVLGDKVRPGRDRRLSSVQFSGRPGGRAERRGRAASCCGSIPHRRRARW